MEQSDGILISLSGVKEIERLYDSCLNVFSRHSNTCMFNL